MSFPGRHAGGGAAIRGALWLTDAATNCTIRPTAGLGNPLPHHTIMALWIKEAIVSKATPYGHEHRLSGTGNLQLANFRYNSEQGTPSETPAALNGLGRQQKTTFSLVMKEGPG